MPRHVLTGFQGGELDPLMSGRVDTDNYKFGLQTCENFMAMATGPLVKRGGFEYIRVAHASAIWLSLFSFSASQEYLIEWDDFRARFFTNGGRVETSPGVPYELATPYAAWEAPSLSLQQSYDRLYVAHGSHAPAAITRTSAVTFNFANLELLNGPFADANTDKSVTVTATDGLGTVGAVITLTATAPIWTGGHVGELFRLEMISLAALPAWEPGMKVLSAGSGCRSDGKVYSALAAGTTGSVQPTHSEGVAYDGMYAQDLNGKGPFGVQWQYLYDTWGIVQIATVAGDGKSATGTVVRTVPTEIMAGQQTWKWAHGAFSNAAGWPSLVALWQGRMIHIQNFDVIGSVVGDYGGGRVNFAATTSEGTATSDLAFRRRLATENPPMWLAVDRQLLLGTATKELAVGAINAALPIAGDNIAAKDQSSYGSEPVMPAQIGLATIFVERGGRRIRSSGYDYLRDRYAPSDLTITARHITRSYVVQLARLRHPWPMLCAVRGDGQLVVHSDTLDDVKGFSRFIVGGGGRVLSACAVTGPDDRTDDLWLLVQRDRQDGRHTEVWRQKGWRQMGDDPQESFYVDAGVRISAAAGQTTFTGLVHLAGQSVACLAAGGVVPGLAVNSAGTLTLPATSVPQDRPFVVIVGLGFTARAVTLPPEVATPGGSAQGMIRRVRKAMVRLLETLGIKVGGTVTGDPLEEVIDRAARNLMDSPIPYFTGDTQGLIDTQFERDGQVQVVSDVPLPAIVTAAMLSLEMDRADA